MHQSPYSLEPRDFPLPEGETTHRLVFIADYVPADLTEITIEVVGGLPGSAYGDELHSNAITLEITQNGLYADAVSRLQPSILRRPPSAPSWKPAETQVKEPPRVRLLAGA